jgi:hypothetical protein
MDTNEKSQSKFPRSSLRARNKTIMMVPAEVQDFTPKSVAEALSFDDIFDDPDFVESVAPPKGSETSISSDHTLVDELASYVQPLPNSGAIEQAEHDSPVADILAAVDDQEEQLVSKASIVIEAPWPEGRVNEESLDEHDAMEPPPAIEPPPMAPIARIVRTLEPQPPPTFAVRVEDESIVQQETDMWEAEELEADSAEAARDQADEPAHAATVAAHRHTEEYRSVMEEGGRAEVIWKKPSRLVGFLVSFATSPLGSYIELREGRLLVSSELNNADNCLLINDSSVSAMHAIMRISSDGSILILDQLSQHGTRIRRADSGEEESLMGEKSHLQHGDVVIFGECEYDVCILKQGRRSV